MEIKMKLRLLRSMRRSISRTVFASLLVQAIAIPINCAQTPEKAPLTKSMISIPINPELYDGIDIKVIINDLIKKAQEQDTIKELPYGIIACYKELQKGAKHLNCKHLEEALPLISYAVVAMSTASQKSIRPSDTDSGNPIVGAASGDMTQVLRGLAKLKKTLCGKFEQTWTMLENIQVNSQTDLSTIFTAISGHTETVCNKFEGTWTRIEGISFDINELFTAIKESTEEACDKFKQTWTMLDDIKAINNTDLSVVFTAISEQNKRACDKFEKTWTMIDAISVDVTTDLSGIFTAISEHTDTLCEKFRQTQTIIENLQAPIVADLSEVYTAIVEHTNELCKKFLQTQTIIENLQVPVETDLTEIYTALAEHTDKLCEKFQQTQTIIENLQISVATDISTVFTAISEQTDTLCEKFRQTQTIIENLQVSTTTDLTELFTAIQEHTNELCEKFRETQTIIQNLSAPLVADLSEVFTAIQEHTNELCEKFRQTQTIIENLQVPVETDLTKIYTAIEGHTDELCDKFRQTWSMLIDITGSACAPTPLFQSDVAAGVLTISIPGTYCLAEDISGRIVIDADRVTLDLNGRQVASAVTTNNISSTGHTNLIIKDGFVNGSNSTGEGLALSNCSDIKVTCVDFKDSATSITLDTVSSIVIDTCFFTTNHPASQLAGIEAINSDTGMIKNCKFKDVNRTDAEYRTIVLLDCSNFITDTAQISNIHTDLFSAAECNGTTKTCTFQSCIVSNCSSANESCIAFLLNPETSDCAFINCCISNLFTTIESMNAVMTAFFITGNKHLVKNTEVTNLTYSGTVGAAGIVVGPFNIATSNCCIINCLVKDNTSTFIDEFGGIIVDDGAINTTIRGNIVKSNQRNGINNSSLSTIIIENESSGHERNFSGGETPVHRIVNYDPTDGGKFDRAPKEFDNISTFTFVGDDVCCPCGPEFRQTWTALENIMVSEALGNCGPIALFADNLVGGVLTISESGCYCLAENIFGQIVINANNVVLDLNGKKVVSSNFDRPLTITSQNDIIVSNGTLKNNAVSVAQCSNIALSNLTVQGMLIEDSSNIKIDGNFSTRSIALVRTDHSTVFNNKVVLEPNGAGILFQECSHCNAISNITENNGTGINCVINSECIKIHKNICQNNELNGIDFAQSKKSIITDNICARNGSDGISLDESTECVVKENICNGNDGVGISILDNTTTSCVSDNICNDNNIGITNENINNSFIRNKAQQNGLGNFGGAVGIPAALIANFDFSSGIFTGATAGSFSNISITV